MFETIWKNMWFALKLHLRINLGKAVDRIEALVFKDSSKFECYNVDMKSVYAAASG